jgi:Restriction endonuclease
VSGVHDLSRKDQLWREFERSVGGWLTGLDPEAVVRRNEFVIGLLSWVPRQIDVFVAGKVAGIPVTVVVECKRHTRPVGIGIVDQFVGKLLDVGADKGSLYSHSGYTAEAITRARNSRSPAVLTVQLGPSTNVDVAEPVDPLVNALRLPDSPEWAPRPILGVPSSLDLGPTDYAYFARTGCWPIR